jgi:hypothetical protein
MPRRKEQKSSRASRSSRKRSLDGRTYTPSPVPRLVTFCPWYAVTVASTTSTSATKGAVLSLTTKTIFATLESQLGIKAVNGFGMRIQSVSLWLPQQGGTLPLDFAVDYYGFTRSPTTSANPVAQIRKREESFGTGMSSARLGYEWPLADRQQVLYSYDDAPIDVLAVQANATSRLVILHIRLLWMSANGTGIPRPLENKEEMQLSSLMNYLLDDDGPEDDASVSTET